MYEQTAMSNPAAPSSALYLVLLLPRQRSIFWGAAGCACLTSGAVVWWHALLMQAAALKCGTLG